MSVERLIPANKLARARKISDKHLLEFQIINKDPLITYAVIRGSSPTPYTCIIDLKISIVGHSCPDFDRRGEWCKHLGKLLLKLEHKQIQAVANQFRSLQTIRSSNTLKEKVQEYKSQEVMVPQEEESEEEDKTNSFSLFELIGILETNIESNKAVKIISKRIKEKLDLEIGLLDPYYTLTRINALLYSLNREKVIPVIKVIQKDLSQYYQRAVDYVWNTFYTKSIVWRYEACHLIKSVNKRYEFGLRLDKLKLQTIPNNMEKLDTYLILEYLQDDSVSELGLKPKDIQDEEIKKRIERHIHHINITGSKFQDIKAWVTKQQSIYYGTISSTQYFDSFGIYLLNLLGEKHEIKLYYRRNANIVHMSSTALENNVGLKFVIDRVKESERDYLTQSEVKNHKMLFNFLEGKDVQTNFRERIKGFQEDIALPEDGLIVQWDISGSTLTNNKLQAFDQNKKLIPDQSTILSTKLQPFDITLCAKTGKRIDEYTYIMVPLAILSTNQVLTLIQKGIDIISNLLPWKHLAIFYKSGTINSGDLNSAIEAAKHNFFVFGAQDLEKELRTLLNYGKTGISEVKYQSIQKELAVDSGQLNTKSRPLLRDFIIAEGEILQKLLNVYSQLEKDQMRLIIPNIRRNVTLEGFRKEFTNSYVKSMISRSKTKLNSEVLTMLSQGDFYPYNEIKIQLSTGLKEELRTLYKLINSDKTLSRNSVARSLIGDMIMKELKLSRSGNMTDDEIAAFQIKLKPLLDR